MSTTAPKDYSEYEGKKVVVMIGDPNDKEAEAKQREGLIQTATPVGILFKDKGRSTGDILDPAQILSIELLPDNRKVAVKYIKEVDLGSHRQHLVDRHGFLISVANTLTEEEAVEIHGKQHTENGADLGHIHGEKPKTRREQAISVAEGAPTEPATAPDGSQQLTFDDVEDDEIEDGDIPEEESD